jgi:opacity protein-like surface antigen
MNLPKLILLAGLTALGGASCASTSSSQLGGRSTPQVASSLTRLTPGQTLATGMIGASYYSQVGVEGSGPSSGTQPSDLEQIPVLGGVFQHTMWGDRVDAGLEVGGTLGFRTGGGYVYAGGNGIYINVKVDMYLFDLFGGPFVSVPLGQKARLYGSAGPLMQFASWDQSAENPGDSTYNQSSTGFGTGVYARAGLEFQLSRAMLIGLGVRWTDSSVSLGNTLGTMDIEGTQAMVTFTAGV